MATISTSNISQKWADNGYWNAETNDKTIYAGYATGSKINYVTRIRILMPGSGVSAQVKIAYKHDGSLNGKQLKYKVVKTEQDATYGNANASTPGDGNLTIAASSGLFVINYTGSFSAGEYLYIYLWTAGSTSVYTLCNIQATSKHSATYTEGTASSISVAGSAIGSPVSFTINSNNAGFTHTLTVSFGNYTSTIADRSTQKSFSWTPPLSTFATFIPNGTAITGTVTLSTYNGSTFIGSNTYDLTLNLPASVVPSLDKSKVSITNVSDNTAVQAWGLLVRNYSRARAVLQSGAASGTFGSTITKTELIYAGQAFTSLQTGILTAAGTFDFTVRVTDSRGRTASVTFSAYVYPYSEPYFLSYEVYRCNASGTPSEDGMYIYAYASVTWSSLNNKNEYGISLRYESSDKLVQGSASLSNGVQEIVSAGLSSRTTYRVTIEVKDSLGKGTTVSVVIPTTEEVDFVIAPRHMKRAALFKYPERDGFEVPGNIWGETFYAGAYSLEKPIQVGPTLEDSSFAPAGYGLGTTCVDVDSWDNAIESGWYRSSGNAHINGRTYGYVTKHTDNWIIQEAFQIDDVGMLINKANRAKMAGVWKPWEWVNPPMYQGVEYRTTERYNNQPVYAKLVNVGTLPNGYKDVYNLASGVKTLVSATLTIVNMNTGATYTNVTEISYWYVGGAGSPYFVMQTKATLTHCEGLVLLKYTKS